MTPHNMRRHGRPFNVPMTAALGPPMPRYMQVQTDTMVPTLKPRDWAILLPADGYSSHGLYVLDIAGQLEIYRCDARATGGIRISRDNPAYPAEELSVAEFDDMVVGVIVAQLSIFHHPPGGASWFGGLH